LGNFNLFDEGQGDIQVGVARVGGFDGGDFAIAEELWGNRLGSDLNGEPIRVGSQDSKIDSLW